MSEVRHTPGPWTVRGGSMVWSSHQYGFDVATIDTFTGNAAILPAGQREASARLIAAAPDLLAACKLALDRFQALEDAEEATEADIAARCAVQDAIRRAETGAP